MILVRSILVALLAAQDRYQPEFLASHNRVRAAVGVPPLEWSPQLAAVAQRWADDLAASKRFAHRPKSQYGENLFELIGTAATPADVVNAWASERNAYDPRRQSCRTGAVCGHYTQIVWRKTRKVGCGMAQSGTRQVWVCNYDPPGNYAGQRPY